MGTFFKDGANKAVPRAYSHERALTASAARIKVNDREAADLLKRRKTADQWQGEAWAYVDAIGEIKYAFNVFSNILSRIRLHAAYVNDDDTPPVPIKESDASPEVIREAQKAMNRVFGPGRQAPLLRRAAYNFLVAGECYLISTRDTSTGVPKEKWQIVSTDELVATDRGFALKTRADLKPNEMTQLLPSDFIGRLWKDHPHYSDEPDSAMRALCDLCNELLLLSRTVRATARSRLNAGAMFIPEELSVSRDVETDDPDDFPEGDEDEFEEELIQAMTTPITDEQSASSVVPLLIRGPADLGEKIKLFKFERSFDPQLTNRADRALERILQGLDMPKEMISGLSQIKYSNALIINESMYTAHIEPMTIMLCDIFRTIYLEPALILAGIDPEEVEKVVIWYDPSGITTAPDKSNAANVGFDKGVLSGEAWRRANGFDPADAPTPTEVIIREVLKRGPLSPEFTDVVIRGYVPEYGNQARAINQQNSVAPIPPDVEQLLNPGEPTEQFQPPAEGGTPPEPGTPPPATDTPPGGPPPPELIP
jgi:hypothetical protein